RKLEKILHPLVQQAEAHFLQKARKRKAKAAVLEIPLLFETGADKRCDYVICVMASKAVQRKRVMQRSGMTEKKLRAIRARHMSDQKKRKLPDYVVNTGNGWKRTRQQLERALRLILDKNHA